jgi:hypothetical protein
MKCYLPRETFPNFPQEEFISLLSVPIVLSCTSFVELLSCLLLQLFLGLFLTVL